MNNKILLYGLLLFPVYNVFSAENPVEKNIRNSLSSFLDDNYEITRIRPSFINGLYEVMIGTEIIYVTGDGRYILKGDLLDLQERRNVTEEQRATVRRTILNKIPVDEMIEFAPKVTNHVIYVFTDVDCGYCRRLHRDVPELNNNGIAVRYLAYPRAGKGSRTYNIMQSVWCSKDRKQALTLAKNGGQIKSKQCKNPVEEQYLLGQKLGVRGTPGIYLENGNEVPGYQPPDELIKLVNE